ncbi:1-aminocyclopropane-1-carboxylate oxidase homolog [Coffea arabica]|uniref:1-aminocyclopropane-1-carboxylate oxidase homolog n=1 Tax=Coffea arabica TaxID=13443 RepID=A0A6P6WS11_COFAR|nr:1-aminocyclopropane-1-carboxylate oxidase homolog [Coffea arabica]
MALSIALHFQYSYAARPICSSRSCFVKKIVPVKYGREIGVPNSSPFCYDLERELRAFDDTKAGVKGLSDSGLAKLPRIFVHDNIDQEKKSWNGRLQSSIPVIELEGSEITDQVPDACERWGFFQVVNHGIPDRTMDKMLERIRMFREQDPEIKGDYYTRDFTRNVAYYSNYDLYESAAAVWKDTITCKISPQCSTRKNCL